MATAKSSKMRACSSSREMASARISCSLRLLNVLTMCLDDHRSKAVDCWRVAGIMLSRAQRGNTSHSKGAQQKTGTEFGTGWFAIQAANDTPVDYSPPKRQRAFLAAAPTAFSTP